MIATVHSWRGHWLALASRCGWRLLHAARGCVTSECLYSLAQTRAPQSVVNSPPQLSHCVFTTATAVQVGDSERLRRNLRALIPSAFRHVWQRRVVGTQLTAGGGTLTLPWRSRRFAPRAAQPLSSIKGSHPLRRQASAAVDATALHSPSHLGRPSLLNVRYAVHAVARSHRLSFSRTYPIGGAASAPGRAQQWQRMHIMHAARRCQP